MIDKIINTVKSVLLQDEEESIIDTFSNKDRYLFMDAIDFAKHTKKEVLFLDEKLTPHVISTFKADGELIVYYEDWKRDYGLIV